MRIISLKVRELHNCFDYQVKFNKDVTFLYGSNGCGKTTILNITEIIITGALYKLFSYNFNNIELGYEPIKSDGTTRFIIIKNNKDSLHVQFEDQTAVIACSNEFDSFKNKDEKEKYYFAKYDILNKIKNSFNYVYLPLDRKTGFYSDGNAEYWNFRNNRLRHAYSHGMIAIDDGNEYYYNSAILGVQSLIKSYYSKINMEISSINNEFRNQILKSSIDVLESFNVDDFIKQLSSKSSVSDVHRTKKTFIRIAKDLNLISEEEEPNYDKFFEDYINQLQRVNKVKGEFGVELIAKYQEISRIKRIATMAEKMENKKEQLYKPIEMFLNTINDFVKTSDDNKELKINHYGELYFETKYNSKRIDIQHLSSGEKQLVIFFSNLIFRVQGQQSGIFVVDEPELSLHLSWQRMFVEKVLDINKNVQLVFATHSPEIIGQYRNKMYKLVKNYVR